MQEQTIKDKLEAMPKELKKEVLDYMEFLLKKYRGRMRNGKFKFDWEGGLSELKEKYTSVELQHKAMELR